MVKFLIVGDLHGIKPKIHFKDFDYIIAPGDFCSDKGLRPWKNKWVKLVKQGKTDLNLDNFILSKIGQRKLKKLDKESLKVGREIIKRLNKFGKPVFIVPGNWDQSYSETRIKNPDRGTYLYKKSSLDHYSAKRTNPFLTKGLKNIYDCQFKLFKFPEFNIVGYGLSSYPEKPIKGNFTKKEYAKIIKYYRSFVDGIDKQYKKRNKNNPTIFLTHNVPYNTPLDKVIDPGSYAHNKHYGSNIARDFVNKRQPLVCIGGHIHEHFKKCKIGKTTAINAGFGRYVNVFMEIQGKKIKKLKFHRGK